MKYCTVLKSCLKELIWCAIEAHSVYELELSWHHRVSFRSFATCNKTWRGWPRHVYFEKSDFMPEADNLHLNGIRVATNSGEGTAAKIGFGGFRDRFSVATILEIINLQSL